MALNQLSIRSYTRQLRSHYHEFHQLVLPLQGSLEVQVGHFQGLVSVGDCVIIPAMVLHSFKSNESARFMVADMADLPENLAASPLAKFVISKPLLAFIQFTEQQLESEQDTLVEETMFELFYQLLMKQSCQGKQDARIAKVIAYLQQNLAQEHRLHTLAGLACVSLTQYKTLFKQSLGMTTGQYLTSLRMQKAKALLCHTDLPIAIVGERVGYQNVSAFSRRFSQYFGQPPRQFLK